MYRRYIHRPSFLQRGLGTSPKWTWGRAERLLQVRGLVLTDAYAAQVRGFRLRNTDILKSRWSAMYLCITSRTATTHVAAAEHDGRPSRKNTTVIGARLARKNETRQRGSSLSLTSSPRRACLARLSPRRPACPASCLLGHAWRHLSTRDSLGPNHIYTLYHV